MAVLLFTASLIWGSGQWHSFCTPSPCPGAVGNGTSSGHYLAALGQRAAVLLLFTASPPWGVGPLPMVPPPYQRDLELAYLRGHLVGLDRHSENPTPPQGAAQLAPQAAGLDLVADTVRGTAPAPQAAPPRAADP